MPTDKQATGRIGEELVVRGCNCFKCKRARTLRRLPPNFKCADIICDFCGYLAQVKTSLTEKTDYPPKNLRSAAWNVQLERMNAGIFFPLFIVLIGSREKAVFYLPADFQTREMFVPRNPLSATARKSGWQGYYYDFTKVKGGFIKVL